MSTRCIPTAEEARSRGRRRRRSGWRRGATSLLAAAAVSGVLGGSGVAAAGGVVVASTSGTNPRLASVTPPAGANPPASTAPSAAFVRDCFRAGATAGCNQAALADIDLARRAEHLPALHLPADFFHLSVPRQLGVVTDRERQARGLAPFTVSSALDRPAQAAAARGDDPVGPVDATWASNLSRGYVTPLAADFAFMYDDGPGSPNLACPAPGAPGCWGHRDNVLAPWPGAQGTGSYNAHGTLQLTQLFVEAP